MGLTETKQKHGVTTVTAQIAHRLNNRVQDPMRVSVDLPCQSCVCVGPILAFSAEEQWPWCEIFAILRRWRVDLSVCSWMVCIPLGIRMFDRRQVSARRP